jgi:hypothetical protein
VRANEACFDNIRYSLSDSDGKLRFVEFEVLGTLRGSQLAKTLTEYFKGRYLKEVSLEDIPRDCCIEDRGCIEGVLEDITKLKQQLCANTG